MPSVQSVSVMWVRQSLETLNNIMESVSTFTLKRCGQSP